MNERTPEAQTDLDHGVHPNKHCGGPLWNALQWLLRIVKPLVCLRSEPLLTDSWRIDGIMAAPDYQMKGLAAAVIC